MAVERHGCVHALRARPFYPRGDRTLPERAAFANANANACAFAADAGRAGRSRRGAPDGAADDGGASDSGPG